MKYIRNAVLYFGCLSLVSVLLFEPLQAQVPLQNKCNEENQREPGTCQEENNENESVSASDTLVQYTAQPSKQYKKRVFQIVKKVARGIAIACLVILTIISSICLIAWFVLPTEVLGVFGFALALCALH